MSKTDITMVILVILLAAKNTGFPVSFWIAFFLIPIVIYILWTD